jgi:predicted N-acyltransferase
MDALVTTPSAGRAEVLSTLAGQDAAEWDAIAHPEHTIQRHGYLRALETAAINDCQYRFFTFRGTDGVLLAHSCFYAITTELDLFLPRRSWLASVIRMARRVLPRFLAFRSIECGVPAALGHTLAFHPRVDTAERRRIVDALADAMIDFAETEGAGLLVARDFLPAEMELPEALAGKGYRRARNLATNQIRITWRSFDEYLASLRHRYRQPIKRDLQRAHEAGLRREDVHDFAPFAARMADLLGEVRKRSSAYERERLGPEFFVSLAASAGDAVSVRLYWLGRELVGFLLTHFGDRVAAPTYMGIDYQYNEQFPLVFNVYYDCIRDAIERGMSVLDFGIANYEVKAKLGARCVPLYVYLRHRRPWLTVPLCWMFDRMTPRHQTIDRHIFHETADAR